jgi:hypothetical protein
VGPIYTAWSTPVFSSIIVSSLIIIIVAGFLLQFAILSDPRKAGKILRVSAIVLSVAGILYAGYRLTGVTVTILQGPRMLTAQVLAKVVDDKEGELHSALVLLDDGTVLFLPQFGNMDEIAEGGCYHTIYYRPPAAFAPVLQRKSPLSLAAGRVAYSNSLVLEIFQAHPYLCTLDLEER